MSGEVTAALENLKAIKSGEDPRLSEEIDSNATPLHQVKQLVDSLYEQYGWLEGKVPRDAVTVCTTYWDSLRGQCYYNQTVHTDKRNFGKRVSRKKHFRRKDGHFIILINRAIIEAGDERGNWRDTVRHEMAHALQRVEHGTRVSSHGKEFKNCARRLGARPRSYHSIRPEWVKE